MSETIFHPMRREILKLRASGDPYLAVCADTITPVVGEEYRDECELVIADNAARAPGESEMGITAWAYDLYLQSPEWREYRAHVLERDGHQCAMCPRRATHCHHRTYERIGWEANEDCVAVCRQCHAAHHGRSVRRGSRK